ncbi:MAG: endonuclease/exonuclease/phosphatase family protein [Paracoccus sp. (in: a-proteobacteria)]|nr:endonuclease/exonuclease/phosphatase family protein [Paracoccus sp. (in: a-proteobacteria)]
MRHILKAIALLSFAGLIGGYGGRLHPLGDSLAVFRPGFAVVLLVAALWLRGPARPLMMAAALLALLPILSQFRPGPEFTGRAFVYQKNLLFDNRESEALFADITDYVPSVVTLQEVSPANMYLVDLLGRDLPHRLICPAHRVGAVAILSETALEATDCREGTGYASARVNTPAGPVTVVVLHLYWPWPHGQPAQVDALIPILESLPRPVIVGGDFNMVPWAETTRRIARATGTRSVSPMEITFSLRGYPLTIDHILVPHDAQASQQRRRLLGSDHYGLAARIGSLTAD